MIVVSHRGPVTFDTASDGSFTGSRGAGGVVSGLLPLVAGSDHATWIAAAMTDGDSAATRAGQAAVDGVDLRLLLLDAHEHRLHYDVVSNATLWFLHHGLYDLPRRPSFDRRFEEAWDAYVAVNEAFARETAAVATPGEVVLVQDYHLTLVPGMVRAQRSDCRVVHFTHTPFCEPSSARVLPEAVSRVMLTSMGGVQCGFHTSRWADAYLATSRMVLGKAGAGARAFVAPLGPDPGALAETASSEAARSEASQLDELAHGRAIVLRVDRIEPSKNIVRGFQAFDLVLHEHPRWRERVVFVALLTPSRERQAEYLAYRAEVERAAARVNERWATPTWQPVVLDTRDDYARSVGALGRYDVLLVNPVRDGLNLIAKEGPLLNEKAGVVCLSREAGSFDELRDAVLEVHPFDIIQTASALLEALEMPATERAARADRLRTLAAARDPAGWLADLVAHA